MMGPRSLAGLRWGEGPFGNSPGAGGQMGPAAFQLGQLAVEPPAELCERTNLALNRRGAEFRTASIQVAPFVLSAESIGVHVDLLSYAAFRGFAQRKRWLRAFAARRCLWPVQSIALLTQDTLVWFWFAAPAETFFSGVGYVSNAVPKRREVPRHAGPDGGEPWKIESVPVRLVAGGLSATWRPIVLSFFKSVYWGRRRTGLIITRSPCRMSTKWPLMPRATKKPAAIRELRRAQDSRIFWFARRTVFANEKNGRLAVPDLGLSEVTSEAVCFPSVGKALWSCYDKPRPE